MTISLLETLQKTLEQQKEKNDLFSLLKEYNIKYTPEFPKIRVQVYAAKKEIDKEIQQLMQSQTAIIKRKSKKATTKVDKDYLEAKEGELNVFSVEQEGEKTFIFKHPFSDRMIKLTSIDQLVLVAFDVWQKGVKQKEESVNNSEWIKLFQEYKLVKPIYYFKPNLEVYERLLSHADEDLQLPENESDEEQDYQEVEKNHSLFDNDN